ncbi:MAG: M48 family metallopeptidase [Gammaproteobacteria bacterium]|nr:M48 family metallopeptidase [Gammaproteobacteria bacterium]
MNTEVLIIKLHDLDVEIVQKDIKNVHLSVYPPNGRVKVSAPQSMAEETIRVFVISKLPWIKKQRQKFRAQERETPREYLERESHYLWGKRYLLKVVHKNIPPAVQLQHSKIVLQLRPGADAAKKAAVLDAWYRKQLKREIAPLMEKWEKKLCVSAARVIVRKMKTKWGSCTPRSKIIRINLELAKKPAACLEYIVVHELTHLIEPAHNSRFTGLLDKHLPKWRFDREELNRLPVRHENWGY